MGIIGYEEGAKFIGALVAKGLTPALVKGVIASEDIAANVVLAASGQLTCELSPAEFAE